LSQHRALTEVESAVLVWSWCSQWVSARHFEIASAFGWRGDISPLDLQPTSSPISTPTERETTMEPITFSLCPECEACPEVAMVADGVRIGEDDNIVRLSHAEWNQLVRLVQSGKLTTVE
jgi:hypothetical protein